MCDPIAIASVGAAAGAYGAYQSQSAQNQALEYQAQVGERNAQLAEIQASNAEARGATEEQQHREKVRQLKGSQRTGFAASGVLVDAGSTLETVQDTAAMGEQDALTIRYNASLEAWGKRAEAGGYRAGSEMARRSKRDPLEAGGMSLLTSAGNMGGAIAGSK